MFFYHSKRQSSEKYSKIINEELKKINVDKVMEDYFSSVLGN